MYILHRSNKLSYPAYFQHIMLERDCIATICLSCLIVSFTLPANSASALSCALTVTEPRLALYHSEPLGYVVRVDEQVVITSNIGNDCIEEQVPFVVIIEVRNADQVTEYLAWQTGVLPYRAANSLGVSWSAQHAGDYEIRIFALGSLENPVILSVVKFSNVTIRL